MSALIGGERPEPPRQLTLRQPHPGTESPSDQRTELPSFLVAVAWRLARLAAGGLLGVFLD